MGVVFGVPWRRILTADAAAVANTHLHAFVEFAIRALCTGLVHVSDVVLSHRRWVRLLEAAWSL